MKFLTTMVAASPEQAVKAAVGVAGSAALWVPALPEHLVLVALSGVAGGVSRWVAARERFWPAGASSVILGCLASIFLWPVGQPILEPWLGKLEMDPTTSVMFGGYVTGLMGLTLITFIIDFTQSRAKRGPEDGDD